MAPIDGDREGYWGKPTATLDWCEENYAVTPYIAEFWNTVSNVVFFMFPLITASYFLRDRVERRFLLSCIGFLAVGIGSWCFHMTLRYDMQLLDELPMIWGSCIFLYCIFECHSKRDEHNKGLIAILFLVCAVTTISYIIFVNPYFFQAAYGTLVIVMTVRGCYLSCWRCIQYSKYLFFYALGTYVTGFILWNIDNHFCPQIRMVRNMLPAPLSIFTQLHFLWHLLSGFATHILIIWGAFRQSLPPSLAVLTQLHAWWHILAALGTHAHIILGCHYRQNILGNQSKVWHSMGFIPFVEVKEIENDKIKTYDNGFHSNNDFKRHDKNKNHYE